MDIMFDYQKIVKAQFSSGRGDYTVEKFCINVYTVIMIMRLAMRWSDLDYLMASRLN